MFVIAVDVSGIPESASRLINGIQNLWYREGSTSCRAIVVKNKEGYVPSNVPRPFLLDHRQ
jgi:hypothetical protein